MDTHGHILYAAILAAIFIADQGKLTLFFPVWAIIAIGSALPAVMVLAAMVCMKTLEAAVSGRHTRGLCLAIERLATMLASKLLGMTFHRSKIANSTAVMPSGIRGPNIKSEFLATPLTDKLNEWVLSVRTRLVPIAVVLATVMCPKTSGGAILEKRRRTTYLAMKEFATMVTSKLTGKAIRRLVCTRTFWATVSANWPGRIWLKAKILAAMFTNGYYWRLFEAHDSTSGYALGFDVGAHLPEMVLVSG